MIDIQAAPATGYQDAAAITATDGKGSKAGDGLGNIGKTEFLRLLVAQLQHQDPLSPLKNEEFIAQLATFSSLEQLISINDGVSRLASQTTPQPADASGVQLP